MGEGIEIRNGIRIDWNVPIEVRDGTVLRADVYRPVGDDRHPVLMSYGPYAKGLAFQDGYPAQWRNLVENHPEVAEGTTTEFANWETADPEKWVPFGYAVVRVDSRGAGESPGIIDPWSAQEADDYYDCIEWAAHQPWSTGSIGLAGVSYYAANQWTVAALRPPHLKAICPFEGFADFYRDAFRHGGILCTFIKRWYPVQVVNVQHGLGERARTSRVTGRGIAGDEVLPEDVMRANRVDPHAQALAEPLLTAFYADRTADLSRIEVPVLSCGNWGGQGLHLRGNVEGFLGAGSDRKWLEIHGREHWTEFYTDYGIALQRAFFDRFLKGEDNGWDERPPVLLQVRRIDGFVERTEREWPLARTQWTRLHLDASSMSLTEEAPEVATTAAFRASDGSLTFRTAPFETETEITGPMAARLFAASSTTDADVFLTVQLLDTKDRPVLFVGAVDPNAPLSLGWLRASHRRLDEERSEPWRPVHTHDVEEPLEPGRVYELEVEIWPTSIVVPKGYRIALVVSGRDYSHDLPDPPTIYGVPQTGVSVMLHDEEADRPPETFGGETTLACGGTTPTSILLPFVPAATR